MKEKAGRSRKKKDRNTLRKERKTRDGPVRKREEGTKKRRERTKEGRQTGRQDSRVHRARVLLAIRALDETQGPSAAAAAASPALAHAGPADL